MPRQGSNLVLAPRRRGPAAGPGSRISVPLQVMWSLSRGYESGRARACAACRLPGRCPLDGGVEQAPADRPDVGQPAEFGQSSAKLGWVVEHLDGSIALARGQRALNQGSDSASDPTLVGGNRRELVDEEHP